MIMLFSQAKSFNQKAKALIVINRASPNPFLAKKVAALWDYISDKKLDDLHLMSSVIYEREAYRNSFSSGDGVSEYCQQGDNAYRDFDNFFAELVEYGQGD